MNEERPIQNPDDTTPIEAAHKDETELTDEALEGVSGGDFTVNKSTDKPTPKLFP